MEIPVGEGVLEGATASLSAGIEQFLDHCRIERGLALNSIGAYRLDLHRFRAYTVKAVDDGIPDGETIRRYLDLLYEDGLQSRSISRHLTTIRNLYGFLLREGRIGADPTEFIPLPKHWKKIPRYLNQEEVAKLLASPDLTKPTGSRDPTIWTSILGRSLIARRHAHSPGALATGANGSPPVRSSDTRPPGLPWRSLRH